MAEKKHRIGKVIVKGLRLSFLSVYEPDKQTDKKTGKVTEKWKANFLIPKDGADECMAKFQGKWMPVLKALKAASEEAKTDKYGDQKNWPKLRPDKLFLRDGDLEEWDGYEGHWYVSAGAPLTEKPLVLSNRKDGNGKWVEAEPGGKNSPFSGAYGNGTLEIWAQDNEHGKRMNAKVKAVQYFADGEPFGGNGPTDAEEDFDDDMVGEEGDLGDDMDHGGDEDEDDVSGMV